MLLLLFMALFMGQTVLPVEQVKQEEAVQQQVVVQEEQAAQEQSTKERQTSFEAKKTETVRQDGIGIIHLSGSLEATEELVEKIMAFAQNPMIKGILLIVDSAGGKVGTSELIFREMQELVRHKPVVTLVINFCTSGAYFIASATDWIIAQESSTMGGIGVKYIIEKHKNAKQCDENNYSSDVDFSILSAGKFKVVTDPNTAPMNEEEKAFIQAYVNNLYHTFTSHVAAGRGLSLEHTGQWADGKNFTGAQSLMNGLIDQVGGRTDAVKKLHELMADRGTNVSKKLAFVS